MKTLLFCCAIIGCTILSAQEIPETVKQIGSLIERKTVVWNKTSISPLSNTIKAPFAKNGWRMELARPLENKSDDGIQEPLKPGDRRNIAELILLAGEPDVKKVFPQLTWLAEPGELATKSVYLGKKWQYHLFLRGDVATIGAINNLLKPVGGEDLYQVYAEALNITDYNDTTRRAAAQLLPSGGDKVIPMINRSIGIALSQDISTMPHFIALKGVGSKAAVTAFASAMRSGRSEIMRNAENALVLPPALKGAETLYLSMLKRRSNLSGAIVSLEELGVKEQVLPIMENLAREPETFLQYAELVFSIYRFRSGANTIPELQLSEEIRLLLARVGDIPGTPKYISVSDKAAEREAELIVAERQRVAPLEKEFAKSKNIECAVCSAVMLCLFKPTTHIYNEAYVKRVNEEGRKLLRSLPRSEVRSILRRLRDSVENQAESDFFRKLLVQIG